MKIKRWNKSPDKTNAHQCGLTANLTTNHALNKTQLKDRFLITAHLTLDLMKWYTVCDSRLRAERWINPAAGCCCCCCFSYWGGTAPQGYPAKTLSSDSSESASLCERTASSCLCCSEFSSAQREHGKPHFQRAWCVLLETNWSRKFRVEKFTIRHWLKRRRDDCFLWKGSGDNFSFIELRS